MSRRRSASSSAAPRCVSAIRVAVTAPGAAARIVGGAGGGAGAGATVAVTSAGAISRSSGANAVSGGASGSGGRINDSGGGSAGRVIPGTPTVDSTSVPTALPSFGPYSSRGIAVVTCAAGTTVSGNCSRTRMPWRPTSSSERSRSTRGSGSGAAGTEGAPRPSPEVSSSSSSERSRSVRGSTCVAIPQRPSSSAISASVYPARTSRSRIDESSIPWPRAARIRPWALISSCGPGAPADGVERGVPGGATIAP